MKHGHPPCDLEGLRRELRDMLMVDASTILHALYCQVCGTRDTAERALALADWDVVQFLEHLGETWGSSRGAA